MPLPCAPMPMMRCASSPANRFRHGCAISDPVITKICTSMGALSICWCAKWPATATPICCTTFHLRSEEHTSELQSLMRNSYAVFCLKKKIRKINTKPHKTTTLYLDHIYIRQKRIQYTSRRMSHNRNRQNTTIHYKQN